MCRVRTRASREWGDTMVDPWSSGWEVRLPEWDVLLVTYLDLFVCIVHCNVQELHNGQMSTNEGILLKRQCVNDIG